MTIAMLEKLPSQQVAYPTEPDMSGPHGDAWEIAKERGLFPNAPPDWAACLGEWIVRAPGANPMWSWWSVTVIHLRDIPGVPPATVRVPGATHEIGILTLDPAYPLPDAQGNPQGHPMRILQPADMIYQFKATDDAAREIGSLAALAICNGRMTPDGSPMMREAWRHSIDITLAHYASGRHVPGGN